MEKLRKSILGLLFCGILLLNGCAENDESKKEEKILEARETGFVSVRKDEEISVISKGEVCAGEYELNGVFSENEILMDDDKLKIVIVKGNKTIVSIAKKNGVIKKGEKIFSIKRKENVTLKENEAVTKQDLDEQKYKKTRVVYTGLLLGDFNLDGVVDISDYAKFKSCYGSIATDSLYDIKCDIGRAEKGNTIGWEDIYSICSPDGAIDLKDLTIFSYNYGKVNPDNYGVKIGGSGESTPYQVIESVENGVPYYIVVGSTTTVSMNKIPNDNTTAQTNHGLVDIYIAKLDASRKIIWQEIIGGTNIDVGKAIVATDRGYVIACESRSLIIKGPLQTGMKEVNVTGKISTTSGSSWTYLAEIDRNGTIIGQAPKIYGAISYINSIIKNISGNGYILVGDIKLTNTAPQYGFIEEMDTSFNYKNSFILNESLNDSTNDIWVQNNSFTGITIVTDLYGTKTYALSGNMYDNHGKDSILMMQFNSNLTINYMQANKPYVFFKAYDSQYSSQIIEDTTGANKGGFIICGYGSLNNQNYALVAQIRNDGFKKSSKLDYEQDKTNYNSIILTNDNRILGVGSYFTQIGSSTGDFNYISRMNDSIFDKNKKAVISGKNTSIIKTCVDGKYIFVGESLNQIGIYKTDNDMTFLQ